MTYQIAAEAADVGGHSLQLAADVFAAGSAVSTTATLLYNGSPVGGATISLSYNSLQFVTNESGVATIAFTAPTEGQRISVNVTTQDGALMQAYMTDLFAVMPHEGVVVIENVTDQLGAPINTFDTQIHYDHGGLQGNKTVNGRIGVILPASDGLVEVRATVGGVSYYTYQPVIIPAGGKAVLHPTFAGATLVQFRPEVDGQIGGVRVNLAPRNEWFTAWPSDLKKDIYIKPGLYEALVTLTVNQELFVFQTNVDAAGTAPMTVPLSSTRSGFAPLTVDSRNSMDQQVTPTNFWLQLHHTTVQMPGNLPIFLQPGSYKPLHTLYDLPATATSPRYLFHLWRHSDQLFQDAAAGQPITFRLGAPFEVNASTSGSAAPNSSVHLYADLRAYGGDAVQPLRCDAQNRCSTIPGTFRVIAPNNQVVQEVGISPEYGNGAYRFPADAAGTYRFQVTYDIGPLGPAVFEELELAIAPPPQLHMTLSQELFATGSSGEVTATLTNHGQPVAGAEVSVGWGARFGGPYTTDAQGRATFTFNAPDWSEAIPLEVQSPDFYAVPAYLFSLRENQAALLVTGATDQTGATIEHKQVALATYWPDGSYDLHSGHVGPNSVFGSVRPAGMTTHVEISQPWVSNNASIYLYGTATPAAGQRNDVQLSGVGAQPVNVLPTLDGTTIEGKLYLHDDRMGGASLYNEGLDPLRTIYLQPGSYSLAFVGTGAGPLVTGRTGITVDGPKNLTLAETSAGLATFTASIETANHTTVGVRPHLAVGRAGMVLGAGVTYRVAPGLDYTLYGYGTLQMAAENGQNWDYWFRVDPLTQRPVNGGTLDFGMGGSVSTVLTANAPTVAGSEVGFDLRISNAAGHRMQPSVEHMWPVGRMVIRDGSGMEVWGSDIYNPDTVFWIRMPQNPGSYTLVFDYPTGPYQGTIHYEQPLEVEPRVQPMTLEVSPKVIPSGAETPVTVRVTQNGQPVAGQEVRIDWGNYTATTDQNGEVTVPVLAFGSRMLLVEVFPAQDVRFTGMLFVLDPGMAALEVTANDAAGKPLDFFWAQASRPDSQNSRDSQGGAVGLVAPAGTALVSMTREGSPAYFMNRSVTLPAGELTRVHFDGQTAARQEFNVTLNTTALPGWLALHPVQQPGTTFLSGLQLDSQGHGVAYITPGSYEALVHGIPTADTRVITRLPAQSLPTAALSFNLESAGMGTMSFTATQGTTLRPIELSLNRGPFNFTIGDSVQVQIDPGTYEPYHMRVRIGQGDGSTWAYGFIPTLYQPVTVQAGATEQVAYDLTLTGANLWTERQTYMPGEGIRYELEALTAANWKPVWVEDAETWQMRAPTEVTVNDANGSPVYQNPNSGPGSQFWQVPSNPSPSYTIHGRRNLGALGIAEAQTTVTQARPLQLLMGREIIPVGQLTPVTFTVHDGVVAIPYAIVHVWGPGFDLWGRANGKGAVTIAMKPVHPGTVEVEIYPSDTQPPQLHAQLFALGPTDSLVEVATADRTGRPLQRGTYMVVRASDGKIVDQADLLGKLVVPAGEYVIYTEGYTDQGDAYYLRSHVLLSAGGKQTVFADGRMTQPLPVSVANRPANSANPRVVLRDLAYPYQEYRDLQLNHNGDSVYAAPGTYEALVVQHSKVFPTVIPVANVTVDGTTTLTVDAATATSRLDLALTAPAGVSTYRSNVGLKTSRTVVFLMVPTLVAVPPGNYAVEDPWIYLQEDGAAERWVYAFEGKFPFTVAPDETRSIDVLPPLTHKVLPAASTVAPGGRVRIKADIQSMPGVHLVFVRHGQTGSWWVVDSQVLITGPAGYQAEFALYDDTEWQAPYLTGTYNLNHTWDLGPLGVSQAAATMQVRSLPRILR